MWAQSVKDEVTGVSGCSLNGSIMAVYSFAREQTRVEGCVGL